jgi:Calcium/calmodulin dependent protein kinase II association domain
MGIVHVLSFRFPNGTNTEFLHPHIHHWICEMSLEADRDAILDLTQRLLVAITSGDWDSYVDLCDESLTCFEPEALGNLVDGLDFHQYYFNRRLSLPISESWVTSRLSRMFVSLRKWLTANRSQRRWKRRGFGTDSTRNGNMFTSIAARHADPKQPVNFARNT